MKPISFAVIVAYLIANLEDNGRMTKPGKTTTIFVAARREFRERVAMVAGPFVKECQYAFDVWYCATRTDTEIIDCVNALRADRGLVPLEPGITNPGPDQTLMETKPAGWHFDPYVSP